MEDNKQKQFEKELADRVTNNVKAHKENFKQIDFDQIGAKQSFFCGLAYFASSLGSILKFVSEKNEKESLLLIYCLTQSIDEILRETYENERAGEDQSASEGHQAVTSTDT